MGDGVCLTKGSQILGTVFETREEALDVADTNNRGAAEHKNYGVRAYSDDPKYPWGVELDGARVTINRSRGAAEAWIAEAHARAARAQQNPPYSVQPVQLDGRTYYAAVSADDDTFARNSRQEVTLFPDGCGSAIEHALIGLDVPKAAATLRIGPKK